ncbi:MAG: lipoprotein insertase outer membrane protein LolB, partial [Legionellales bacterium]
MNAGKQVTVISFCLLTACAAPPKPAEALPMNKVIPLEQRKTQTSKVSSWEINGAMAAKNKSKGWSATMNWLQQGPSAYQIRLIGPLGGGSVLIKRSGSTVSFQDGAKKSTSSNADELLVQQTGIRLPVNNLYYWVRGLPAPGS